MNAPTVWARVDLLDGEQVRQSWPVPASADGSPVRLRLGRALDCEVHLDDPHCAGLHGWLQVDAEQAVLEPAPSLSGASDQGQALPIGQAWVWPSERVLQMGQTRLRLRHAATPLAPEQPLARGHHAWPAKRLHTAALALLVLAWFLGDLWVARDASARWMDYLAPVLAVGAAVWAWAGFWALLSQLFLRRFPLQLHLRRALLTLLGLELIDAALPALAFMASAPGLLVLETLLSAGVLAACVYGHARDVWPRRRRMLAVMALSGLLVWLGVSAARQDQQQHRWRPPYLSTVLPPALRAAPLRSVDDLLKDAAALQPELAAKAKLDPGGEPE
ncbi:hypothetical protein HNQ51_000727 [Inhella inkyongensis]|uniref:FHA domain-containing protein n=1 Tax=Inhella inkyongensis TaxID=392593 RepID=A0A840S3M5_9BURK|nr:FHA domain-containing protein [Inhella inkyongensis]MBB5203434.1 hypothetical protein [Inhella inkyongensis]